MAGSGLGGVCGRRTKWEAACPSGGCPPTRKVNKMGMGSARQSTGPKPLPSASRVQGHAWCYGEWSVRAGMAHSEGRCWHQSAHGCPCSRQHGPWECPHPTHPYATLISSTLLLVEGLLKGRRYQGRGRGAWGGSVCPLAHACTPTCSCVLRNQSPGWGQPGFSSCSALDPHLMSLRSGSVLSASDSGLTG